MADDEKTHDPAEMRLVLIEWEDSVGADPRWQLLEDTEPRHPAQCRSVGWLACDEDDYKTVIPHTILPGVGVCAQGSGDMTIPTSAVRRIVDLVVS